MSDPCMSCGDDRHFAADPTCKDPRAHTRHLYRNDAREHVNNILVGYVGGCTCHAAYYERNLADPDCVYHFVGYPELLADLTELVMKAHR